MAAIATEPCCGAGAGLGAGGSSGPAAAPAGTVRLGSRVASAGGLADLVADAERERVSNQALSPCASPPPPASGRMLRVEVHGLLHDWFDVGDMGDFIRSPHFAGTLRENVSRYFSVPLERQAIYDEDGLLTTCADFSRALQRVYPKLYVYDLDEMGPELRARAVEELRQLDAEVEQSWRQFGAGSSPRSYSFDKAPPSGLVVDATVKSAEGTPGNLGNTVERSYVEGGSGGTGWQQAAGQTAPSSSSCRASSEQQEAPAYASQVACQVNGQNAPRRILPDSDTLAPQPLSAVLAMHARACDDLRDMSTRYVTRPAEGDRNGRCSTPPRMAAATTASASQSMSEQRATPRMLRLDGTPQAGGLRLQGTPLQATPVQATSSFVSVSPRTPPVPGSWERFLDAGVAGGVRISSSQQSGLAAPAPSGSSEPRQICASSSGHRLVVPGTSAVSNGASGTAGLPGQFMTQGAESAAGGVTPRQYFRIMGSQPVTPRMTGTPQALTPRASTPVPVPVSPMTAHRQLASAYPGVVLGAGAPAWQWQSTEQASRAQTPFRSQTPPPARADLDGPWRWQQPSYQPPQVQPFQLQLSAMQSGLPAPPGISFQLKPHLPQLPPAGQPGAAPHGSHGPMAPVVMQFPTG